MHKPAPGCPDHKSLIERSCPVGIVCAMLTICQHNADVALLNALHDGDSWRTYRDYWTSHNPNPED